MRVRSERFFVVGDAGDAAMFQATMFAPADPTGRKCTVCQQHKPDAAFYQSKGRVRSKRKQCWEIPTPKRLFEKSQVGKRTCHRCHKVKRFSEFYRKASNWAGVRHECKECCRKDAARKHARDPEALKKSIATWRESNPERYEGSQRARRAKHKAELREWVDELRSGPCSDCGKVYPVVCMDFDHVDARGKRFAVSAALMIGAPSDVVKEEIARCELVCSNCHRVRTAVRYKMARDVRKSPRM